MNFPLNIKRRHELLKIGVIGCGHWGKNHVRFFYFSKGVKVEICCDKDRNRLAILQETYPDLNTTTDYNMVIRDKKIDAVVIATPTATHYQLVKACLLSGKHVLCEKPLTIKEKESEELVSLAKKSKRILMVGYVFLFNNGIIALEDCIKKNELGKVLYMHFTRTNLGPIRNDVDVIYDLASHDVSIASFLLKSWPKKVSADAGFFLRKKISDTAFINLYYPNNILVNIHASWLNPKKVRKITCIGDKKMAAWDDLDASEPIKIYNKAVKKEKKESFYADYGEFQLLPKEGDIVSPLVKLKEPLRNQNSYFLNCIDKRKTPITNATFGHNVTKVLEAIQLSIKNKGIVWRVT